MVEVLLHTKICVEYDTQSTREEERGDQTPELGERKFEHPWNVEDKLFGANKASMRR
jgi:hypothetical protein